VTNTTGKAYQQHLSRSGEEEPVEQFTAVIELQPNGWYSWWVINHDSEKYLSTPESGECVTERGAKREARRALKRQREAAAYKRKVIT
jgi:hypothetical protein